MLNLLRANGCPWNEGTCCLAASTGQLDVLMWANVNGCPCTEEAARYAFEEAHSGVAQS
ncbi:unnamed protein product [Choristocarpus tenellus]